MRISNLRHLMRALWKQLARILEVVQKRIIWLESLKTDADARQSLSEKTGIELTQEALD